jgi:hypothetical protein
VKSCCTTIAKGMAAVTAALLIGAAAGLLLDATLGAAPAPPERPRLLSATGLYADPATLTVDPRHQAFTPQYPLWTDGAAKRRWVSLPAGAVIDTRRVDRWDFPVGTKFWKEFSFGGRKVETRMLWKTAPGHWEFAAYAWNAAQTDAALVPDDGIADAAEVAPGKFHSIPGLADCRNCHDAARTEVLGFTALNLSTDRDPLAPHAEALEPGMATLATLDAQHRFSPARPEWVAAPPRVAARDPKTRAALGYLSTNCGTCHNRESTIASLGLDLQYRVAGDERTCLPGGLATTVGQPGHWVVPTAPEGTSRLIEPGRPELSAVIYRARSRRPASQMPPLGSVVADREAIALLTAWVQEGAGTTGSGCRATSQHQ